MTAITVNWNMLFTYYLTMSISEFSTNATEILSYQVVAQPQHKNVWHNRAEWINNRIETFQEIIHLPSLSSFRPSSINFSASVLTAGSRAILISQAIKSSRAFFESSSWAFE